jgi:hypothetical protein
MFTIRSDAIRVSIRKKRVVIFLTGSVLDWVFLHPISHLGSISFKSFFEIFKKYIFFVCFILKIYKVGPFDRRRFTCLPEAHYALRQKFKTLNLLGAVKSLVKLDIYLVSSRVSEMSYLYLS